MAGIPTLYPIPDAPAARLTNPRWRGLRDTVDALLPRQRTSSGLPVTTMAEALAIGLGCDRRG